MTLVEPAFQVSREADPPPGTPIWRRIVGIALSLAAYSSLTYLPNQGWGWSILGSILIVIGARITFSSEGWQKLGLRIPARQVPLILLMLLGVSVGSFFLIRRLTWDAGLALIPIWRDSPLFILHIVGQTLNEEMVLGAMLLSLVRWAFPRISTGWISVGVAMSFSAMHFAFYRWILQPIEYSGTLSLWTLANLCVVGTLRNTLILHSGHIGFSWALHFGFNVVFFSSFMWHRSEGYYLNEPTEFNTVLGHPMSLATTLLLLLAGLRVIRTRETTGVIQAPATR